MFLPSPQLTHCYEETITGKDANCQSIIEFYNIRGHFANLLPVKVEVPWVNNPSGKQPLGMRISLCHTHTVTPFHVSWGSSTALGARAEAMPFDFRTPTSTSETVLNPLGKVTISQ